MARAKQLRFQYCPNCGGFNIHETRINIYDKYMKAYFCGTLPHGDIPAGCGWIWCKPFEVGGWVMARNTYELETFGGIPFDEHKVLYRCPQ